MKLSFDFPRFTLGETKYHLHLSADELQYVADHGHVVQRGGVEFIVLSEYDIPIDEQRKGRFQRLIGIEALVCPTSGCLHSIHRQSKAHRLQPYKRHQRRGQSYRWQYA